LIIFSVVSFSAKLDGVLGDIFFSYKSPVGFDWLLSVMFCFKGTGKTLWFSRVFSLPSMERENN
jgi:hypothetical protein